MVCYSQGPPNMLLPHVLIKAKYVWRKRRKHVCRHKFLKVWESFIPFFNIHFCALKHTKAFLQFTLYLLSCYLLWCPWLHFTSRMNTIVNLWVTVPPSSLIFSVSFLALNKNFLFSPLEAPSAVCFSFQSNLFLCSLTVWTWATHLISLVFPSLRNISFWKLISNTHMKPLNIGHRWQEPMFSLL